MKWFLRVETQAVIGLAGAFSLSTYRPSRSYAIPVPGACSMASVTGTKWPGGPRVDGPRRDEGLKPYPDYRPALPPGRPAIHRQLPSLRSEATTSSRKRSHPDTIVSHHGEMPDPVLSTIDNVQQSALVR